MPGIDEGSVPLSADAPPPEVPAASAIIPPLPDDLLGRVRALPEQTLLRVPRALRARLCDITATVLESCNAGCPDAAVLEQARSKLLLGRIPRGHNMAHELRARFDLWDSRRFAELTARAELQADIVSLASALRAVSDARRHAHRAL